MTHSRSNRGRDRILTFKTGTGNQHVHIGAALAGVGDRFGQTGLDIGISVHVFDVREITGDRHFFIAVEFSDQSSLEEDLTVLRAGFLQQSSRMLRRSDRITQFNIRVHGNAQSNGGSIRFLDFLLQNCKALLVIFRGE